MVKFTTLLVTVDGINGFSDVSHHLTNTLSTNHQMDRSEEESIFSCETQPNVKNFVKHVTATCV